MDDLLAEFLNSSMDCSNLPPTHQQQDGGQQQQQLGQDALLLPELMSPFSAEEGASPFMRHGSSPRLEGGAAAPPAVAAAAAEEQQGSGNSVLSLHGGGAQHGSGSVVSRDTPTSTGAVGAPGGRRGAVEQLHILQGLRACLQACPPPLPSHGFGIP